MGKKILGLSKLIQFVFILTFIMQLCLISNAKELSNSLQSEDKRLLYNNISYEAYLKQYEDRDRPEEKVVINATDLSNTNKSIEILDELEGVNDVVKVKEEDVTVEWEVNIPKDGLYNIKIDYYTLPWKDEKLKLKLMIDRKIPFDGASLIQLTRVWRDQENIKRDNRGNDLTPKQEEVHMWLSKDLEDKEGFYNEPYLFYFSKGKHKLSLTNISQIIAINQITLYNKKPLLTYHEYKQNNQDNESNNSDLAPIKHQAEKTYLKSDPVIRPIADRTSCTTEPNHYSKIRLNIIGGEKWKHNGEWITWKFNVPKDGFYKLGLKYRQDITRGMYETRKVYIDGKIPFKELANVTFPYDEHWKLKILGDNNPYEIYLTEGEHTLTMEVSLGDYTKTLRTVQDSVYKLNEIYRQIIMITGSKPDVNRGYNLEYEIPNFLFNIKDVKNNLKAEVNRLNKILGTSGSEVSTMDSIVKQLESFLDKPFTITQRLTNYRDKVSALAAWILKMKEQPLELDYIIICPKDKQFSSIDANFFSNIAFRLKMFVSSFFENYNNIGDVHDEKDTLVVWINAGRDQAQVLKRLCDDQFIPQTNIPVNLMLVQGAIVQATLAGKGPDIAVNLDRYQPINLALRGALVDISQFDDFKEVTKSFYPSAMVPYKFKNSYYALPVQQNFNVMFYRKDVFDELNLKVPNTWDDLYDVIIELGRNNMNVGLVNNADSMKTVNANALKLNNIFSALLLQNDCNLYNDSLTGTNLDKKEALDAFEQWTDFYTNYGLPAEYNFYERFRTGEMPLGIQPYTLYNLLTVAAPEISNLWDMAPIPGTKQADGSISRAQSSMGSSVVIFDKVKDKQAAWEFLKWFTSEEIQTQYGRGLEELMGPAARYDTANKKALTKLPWSDKESKFLLEQMSQIVEIPELPGSYYTTRCIDNAYNDVINNKKNSREMLNYWNKYINEEIKRKYEEFGYKVD